MSKLVGITPQWNCGNCVHSNKELDGDYFCLENSPQLGFIQVPAPNTELGFVPVPVSGWPKVRPTQWCGKHPERMKMNARLSAEPISPPLRLEAVS